MRRVPRRIRSCPLKPKYNGLVTDGCSIAIGLKGPIVWAPSIKRLRKCGRIRRVRRKPNAAVQSEPRTPAMIPSCEHEINHSLLYIVCNGVYGHLEYLIAHLWDVVDLRYKKAGNLSLWR